MKTPLIISFIIVSLMGCTNVFFQPNQKNYLKQHPVPVDIKEVTTTTKDGITLTHWWLKAYDPEGTIFFLHGNAQNISAHIQSVYWLTDAGFNVFMFEYRGYADPQVPLSLEKTFGDIDVARNYVMDELSPNQPFFMLGQSLGAAIGIYSMATASQQQNICAGIFEAPFTSYREIAQEKLGSFWLTWPFQYPLSWLVTDDYSAEEAITEIDGIPVLIIQSDEDTVVPYHHGKTVYEQANEPREFYSVSGPHISTYNEDKHREKLLKYLYTHTCPAKDS